MSMTRKEALYELGRYKKKVADQQKEIRQLRDKLKMEDLKQLSNEAIVALMLLRLGADSTPCVIGHREVREAIRRYTVLIDLDLEQETYSLRVEEKEANGHVEGAEAPGEPDQGQ